MGIRNLHSLGTHGCQAEVEKTDDDGETVVDICGRDANATIHRPTWDGYHEFQENASE